MKNAGHPYYQQEKWTGYPITNSRLIPFINRMKTNPTIHNRICELEQQLNCYEFNRFQFISHVDDDRCGEGSDDNVELRWPSCFPLYHPQRHYRKEGPVAHALFMAVFPVLLS